MALMSLCHLFSVRSNVSKEEELVQIWSKGSNSRGFPYLVFPLQLKMFLTVTSATAADHNEKSTAKRHPVTRSIRECYKNTLYISRSVDMYKEGADYHEQLLSDLKQTMSKTRFSHCVAVFEQ